MLDQRNRALLQLLQARDDQWAYSPIPHHAGNDLAEQIAGHTYLLADRQFLAPVPNGQTSAARVHENGLEFGLPVCMIHADLYRSRTLNARRASPF